MRISDWSADVCSSDLGAQFGKGIAMRGMAELRPRAERREVEPLPRRQLLQHGRPVGGGHGVAAVARLAQGGEQPVAVEEHDVGWRRSEEHTSELQSLMRISYAVFCLNKKKRNERTMTMISKAKISKKKSIETEVIRYIDN